MVFVACVFGFSFWLTSRHVADVQLSVLGCVSSLVFRFLSALVLDHSVGMVHFGSCFVFCWRHLSSLAHALVKSQQIRRAFISFCSSVFRGGFLQIFDGLQNVHLGAYLQKLINDESIM
jgi:hypothetical protein